MKKILITGALGQIGSELTGLLRQRYGSDKVIATDIRTDPANPAATSGPFRVLDCRDGSAMLSIIRKEGIVAVYHLAAILSATAEKNPGNAWEINMEGLRTVLETARICDCSVFVPSSIAVFGPDTPCPSSGAPQDTILRPATMYGVTKVAGELLGDYYHAKSGLDTRGVRFPGIISNVSLPGGGTTDYAVHIYYDAVRKGRYSCFLRSDTYIEMMYMPDALDAVIRLMEADPTKLRHRNAFNISAMSVCPADIAASIGGFIPGFTVTYDVDPERQRIADTWPRKIDDSAARAEWGWEPRYDLARMTADMIETLRRRIGSEGAAGSRNAPSVSVGSPVFATEAASPPPISSSASLSAGSGTGTAHGTQPAGRDVGASIDGSSLYRFT